MKNGGGGGRLLGGGGAFIRDNTVPIEAFVAAIMK